MLNPDGRHRQAAISCLNALDNTLPVSGRLREIQAIRGVLDAGDQHNYDYVDRYELDAEVVVAGKGNTELRWKRADYPYRLQFVVPPGGVYINVHAYRMDGSRVHPYEISTSVDGPARGRYPTQIRRGRFLSGAGPTRLHLGQSYGPTELTWLWHEDGPPVLVSLKDPYRFDASAFSVSSMDILGTCRQDDADREILLLLEEYGGASYVSGWSVNSETNAPEAEFYHTHYGETFGRVQRGRLGLGAACTWQREDEAASIIYGLRVDSDGDESDSTDIVTSALSRMVESGNGSRFRLPVRTLTADAVEHALLGLMQISGDIGIVFEGATYATEADRARWRVVQIHKTRVCRADGVVLLHDREMNQWQAIYDVPSGCTFALAFPLGRMMVQEGKMFVDMCHDCSFRGATEEFVLDLSTMDIVMLDGEDPRPEDLENPALDDAYLRSAVSERGWLAIGTESASHAFSFGSADDAVNACGFVDCEVVETFTACLAVAYSSETTSGVARRSGLHQCDQLGISLLPWLVRRRNPRPSRPMSQICLLPSPRVDVNARCRPLGE